MLATPENALRKDGVFENLEKEKKKEDKCF